MTSSSTGAPSRPAAGRPRNSDTTALILQAALDLGEKAGFGSLTMEGIAAHAGVAKTTIYRRWPSVWGIVMDAFLAEITKVAPLQKRPTARASFKASMRLLAKSYRGRQGKILHLLLGQAQLDEKLRREVTTRWVVPRREVALEFVRHGIETGELRRGLDPDIVLDALYGPLYHRLLVPYDDAPITDAYVDSLVDTVFRGLER
ncbi:MAG: TetR/AcrR family transcriptional regulator [Reyranella sp.]|uniref:TetR/AcrR family transcriptional regulator n=1 Tax=Reyranella sp. TaxID=1929291 RepID=UPI0025FAE803|nr:TetR/AcrR family transcriptional regulator [Reyranella sp.]MBR2816522.1 TetR/AcrR family transcriptional regulator [Reyranella sp.]